MIVLNYASLKFLIFSSDDRVGQCNTICQLKSIQLSEPTRIPKWLHLLAGTYLNPQNSFCLLRLLVSIHLRSPTDTLNRLPHQKFSANSKQNPNTSKHPAPQNPNPCPYLPFNHAVIHTKTFSFQIHSTCHTPSYNTLRWTHRFLHTPKNRLFSPFSRPLIFGSPSGPTERQQIHRV